MTGLATLPEASAYPARGGGGGARPVDPSLLAAHAFSAATGDDQETALKLYDYGVENYGEAFVAAYNSLRDERALGAADVTPDKPGTLKQVSEVLDGTGPGRTKAGTAAHALPEPPIANITGPGETSAGTAAGAVPDRPYLPANTNAGTAAGRPPDRVYPGEPAAGTSAALSREDPLVYPGRTLAGTASGVSVPTPPFRGPGETSAGTSAIAAPNRVIAPGETRAGTSEALSTPPPIPGRTLAGTAGGLSTATPLVYPNATKAGTAEALSVPTPADTGLRSVRSKTAAGTAAGTDAGSYRGDGTDVPAPTPSGKWGLQPDGTYIDIPPGGEVVPAENTITIHKASGLPARMADDPRIEPGDPRWKGPRTGGGGGGGPNRNLPPRDRPMVASPESGGVSSVVQLPPAAPPPPPQQQQANGPPIQLTPAALTPAAATAPPPAGQPGPAQPPPTIDDGFMSKPDVWSFLTSAGLGAMASQSPNFLGAVGAGGKVGLDQLTQLRKDQRDKAKTLADAEFQRRRIELGYAGEAGQTQRTGMQIGSNEKIADLQDRGATGRTSMQIGSNERVANLQDQGATNRTGMQIGSNERVANLQDQGATNRTGMQIGSNERVANLQDQGATNRTGMQTQSQERITDRNNQSQQSRQDDAQQFSAEQAERKNALDRDLYSFQLDEQREGKILTMEDAYNWYRGKGASEQEAREWSAGFHQTDPKVSPMSKDEVAQTLDLAAGNVMGQGATNQELMAALPADVAAEVYRELGKHGNSGSAADAVIRTIQKYGRLTDESLLGGRMGFSKEWKFHRLPAASPAATPAPPPASGQPPASAAPPGPRFVWDDKLKKMVPVQ